MLYKNVFRTLKKQYVQLILLGVIILLSSYIYTTMDYGIGGIVGPTEDYFEVSNQEDFAISMKDIIGEDDLLYIEEQCGIIIDVSLLSQLKNTDESCYYSVLDNRLNIIQNEYSGVDLEVREHIDVYFTFEDSAHKVRVLKGMDTINLSYFVEGQAPLADNEIAISEIYGKNNDLEVGDQLVVGDKTYVISGYVLFPDYSLALFSNNFIIDNKTQTVGLLTDCEFESYSIDATFTIAGVFTTSSISEFEAEVIDTYLSNSNIGFVNSIILTENNMRSGAVYAEIEGGQATGLMLSILIASIGLLIVAIMVTKILDAQRGPIGILKSMGYKNSEITIPYILYIGLLALPTLVFGYYLGTKSAEPMRDLYLLIYLLPSQDIAQNLTTFFIAVLLPFTFLLSISYLIIRKILSQKPVTLLNPVVTSNTNIITKIAGKYLKRLSIVKKLKHLLLYRNIIKFIVYLTGLFYAAFLIYFSFSMMGIFQRAMYDYYDSTSHNYIGYCELDSGCPPTSGTQDQVIEIPSALLNDEEITVVGIDIDNDLHQLFDKRDKNITDNLENGIIITRSLNLVLGYKIGDEFTLEIGTEQIDVEIVGIQEEYNGNKIYVERSNLSLLMTGITEDYYNTIYSETELNNEDFMFVLSNVDILEQSEQMQGLMDSMFKIMIATSIIIGGIIIYILTVMTIEDNFYNISLFKVIGYNDKEINKMILGGYSLYGNIIFILAVPVTYIAIIFITNLMAVEFNMILPLEIQWWQVLIGIAINNVIFYIGAFAAKRKLSKISLQESMKMYQV